MSGTDLAGLDIAALARLIAAKEVSPVEVAQAYLERIDRLNGQLNAYISVYPELALEAARRAEAEIAAGAYRGPLHGVPLAVKDLYQVAGMHRTCGSRLMEGAAAETEDATSVSRLKAAGAVILGMLNLHEFAFGPTGVNPHFGTARNPWDLEKVCGGSSSGAGCAVAASLAAGALGTDTGGSIRIPAALCGVVGLKQTYGLASRRGIYPLSDAFDHGGPIARTVRDAALMLQAIAGEDDADATTRGSPVADYTSELGPDLSGMRIGVPRKFFFEDLHGDVADAVGAALEALASLGAAVEEIDLPFDAHEAARAWNVIALAEAYAIHETHVEEQGDALSPDVKERLVHGRDLLAKDFVKAGWTRDRVKRGMAELLARVDLLAVPTTPIPAVPIDGGTIAVGGHEVEGPKVLGRLTRLACLTGQPAVSVPCGFTGEGLPIGLQLIGGWFREPALLRAAHAYEQAAPWRQRRPPLAA